MTIDEERLRAFEVGTFVTKDDMDYTIAGNSAIEGRYVDGFLLVGLIVHFQWNLFPYRDEGTWALNYGLERVRFPGTVWVGERIRCHIDLLDSKLREPGRTLVTTRNTIEVEGKEKPAMVADWVCLFIDGDAEWDG